MATTAAVHAALEQMVQSVKASPYRRAYSGYGAAPRLRLPRLPRVRVGRGLPRPAADPYGVYGARRTPATLARIPGIPRLR